MKPTPADIAIKRMLELFPTAQKIKTKDWGPKFSIKITTNSPGWIDVVLANPRKVLSAATWERTFNEPGSITTSFAPFHYGLHSYVRKSRLKLRDDGSFAEQKLIDWVAANQPKIEQAFNAESKKEAIQAKIDKLHLPAVVDATALATGDIRINATWHVKELNDAIQLIETLRDIKL